MANIGNILKSQELRLPRENYEVKMIHYSKLIPSSMQNREERNIEAFADILEEAGEIKQPLLVRRHIGDTYEVLAGHRRRLAAIYNAEKKGLEKFSFLPCKIDKGDDTDAEINLITTNLSIDRMTAQETLEAVVRLKELLHKKYKGAVKGRELREKIANTLSMSASKIAKIEAVSNNLITEGKDCIKTNTLSLTAAYELSGLKKEEQRKLLAQGKLDLKSIQGAKVRENGKKKNLKKEACSKEPPIELDEVEGLISAYQKKYAESRGQEKRSHWIIMQALCQFCKDRKKEESMQAEK